MVDGMAAPLRRTPAKILQYAGPTEEEVRMPRIDEYEGQDALGLAAWVRAGEVSPQELLEAAVARVEALDPALNAVVIRAFEEGRKAIEAGLPDGPLRGVPWLLKDLHAAWKGVRLTNG